MAVQAQFGGGGLAGSIFPYGGGLAEEQLHALLSLSAAAATNKQQHPQHQPHQQQYHHSTAAGVASAAHSDLTCNGNNGGFGAVVTPSRKRGRVGGDELDPFHHHHSSAALLPIPGTTVAAPAPESGRTMADDSAAASTSGRPLPSSSSWSAAVAEAELVAAAEMAEVEAVVRAACERLRVGLERATKRRCESLAAAAAAVALREKEAELCAARRRAAELEERLRVAAGEAQAWCGLARSHEAAACGLRATLDALLLQAKRPAADEEQQEGCGESAEDAESCCFVGEADAAGTAAMAVSSPAKWWWVCRGCGEREATVLLLPCRHLVLCKACEPRADICPVCDGEKNTAIHIEPCN